MSLATPHDVKVKALLVNPPNHFRDTDDLAPPLGLLCLAAALSGEGISVELLDLNLRSCTVGYETSISFYESAVAMILNTDPDIIGFTSMAINSHVALQLAAATKRHCPEIFTIFGGPHFGALGDRLIEAFDFVDAVVTGEGENAAREIARDLQTHERPSRRTWRASSRMSQGHPWTAYPLIDLNRYYSANPRRVLNGEAGRGCKYHCRFCYSPTLWNGAVELSPDIVAADFAEATARGAEHLFVVGDNYLNDPNVARTICRALEGLSQRPTWNCYGTLPDLRPDIIEHLSRAGCRSIYLGIDAVTEQQRTSYGKSFVKSLDRCCETIQLLVDAGVTPTCSFILDPLRLDAEELEENLRWAAHLRARGAELSFHVLTPYTGTALKERRTPGDAVTDSFRISLRFDCPPAVIENPLVGGREDLFPFHVGRAKMREPFRFGVSVIHAAQCILTHFPDEIADLLRDGRVSFSSLVMQAAEAAVPTDCDCVDPLIAKEAVLVATENILCQEYGFALS